MSRQTIHDPVAESIEKRVFIIPEHQELAAKYVEKERTNGLRKNKNDFKHLSQEGLSYEERQITASTISAECITLNKSALKVAKDYQVIPIEEADTSSIGCYHVIKALDTTTEESHQFYVVPNFIGEICFIPPTVTMVSPASAIGKKIFGKKAGDICEIEEWNENTNKHVTKRYLLTHHKPHVFPLKS